ncbi:efflux RND transporter periplasmic adaptor subunit [Mesorhizobium microcysteis]|uniref:Efflux RND transporter periplasmic adaptor subunit n=1 Tax=Neoaquamicrobium microcysteis TaxID=2682781 RepID=A0A5D4H068_9HYPH|nr:efflux RND transporter periplasmic adaptor subunit [Mesorhizobium microcysteis]TYR32895.1 efflux RND transporter periplasmic adaptor subunit [Mesorhizobium microcysteis]
MDQIVERPDKAKFASPEPIEKALSLDGAGGRPRRRRRRWPLVVAFAVLAGGAAAYWQFAGTAAPQTSYRTATVEPGAMTVEVSATGTLQPLTQVEVSSELSGVVRSVAVDENQRVAAGDVLAELDTTRIVAQIERAEANVAAAAARVADAEVTLRETEQVLARTQQLSGRGMTTEQALETASAARDRADSAVAIARANLAVSEAELKLQQADLAKSTIYAPIDGIVLSRAVNPGQTVASSMQAPILFVIAENLETMELKAAVDEADIGTVSSGQPARFTVDAFPGRRFDATIRDISYASVVTEGVVTYQARLNVDNGELLLRPGMTATVDIVTREADGVLLVPAAAFRFSPPAAAEQGGWSIQSLFMPRMRMGGGFGGRRARDSGEGRPLYVLRDGEPQQVRVVTGATDGESVEILSGLEQGDRVVLSVSQGGGQRAAAEGRSGGGRP